MSQEKDICELSTHVDGQIHSWVFDGDDPYIVCHFCKQTRDALNGRIITNGYTA